MTTTILVFNSSHEDASATPPRAQAFFRTQKRNPFRGRATTSRRAKPHASAFHARRTRRDVQIHKPRARFLSSASRPRLFLRALTREPHFRVQKRASWISARYIRRRDLCLDGSPSASKSNDVPWRPCFQNRSASRRPLSQSSRETFLLMPFVVRAK